MTAAYQADVENQLQDSLQDAQQLHCSVLHPICSKLELIPDDLVADFSLMQQLDRGLRRLALVEQQVDAAEHQTEDGLITAKSVWKARCAVHWLLVTINCSMPLVMTPAEIYGLGGSVMYFAFNILLWLTCCSATPVWWFCLRGLSVEEKAHRLQSIFKVNLFILCHAYSFLDWRRMQFVLSACCIKAFKAH